MANIPSVPAEDLPPLSFMDREISANLNATMFFVFLMGIPFLPLLPAVNLTVPHLAVYSVVYSATLYIYRTYTTTIRVQVADLCLLVCRSSHLKGVPESLYHHHHDFSIRAGHVSARFAVELSEVAICKQWSNQGNYIPFILHYPDMDSCCRCIYCLWFVYFGRYALGRVNTNISV